MEPKGNHYRESEPFVLFVNTIVVVVDVILNKLCNCNSKYIRWTIHNAL